MANFSRILQLLECYKPSLQGLTTSSKQLSINLKKGQTVHLLVLKKGSRSGIGKVLQHDLHNYLTQNLPNYNWSEEYKLLCNDKADIVGQLDNNTVDEKSGNRSDISTIIIELDNARADQVAKKYVSRRLANAKLFRNKALYVHVLYCTEAKINPSEAYKYLGYCKRLSKTKLYIGIILTDTTTSSNISIF